MLGAPRCENDKLPISYFESSANSRKIGAKPGGNTETINKPNSVSIMIGMLTEIAYVIANTLGVVMNSCSTTSWPGYDEMIGVFFDIVYFIADTLGVVMTSGQIPAWHDYDSNMIEAISAKLHDTSGVVYND